MSEKRKTGQGENMVLAGIDQDQAAADETYEHLSPHERGEIVLWLTGKKGDLCDAPEWVLKVVALFASLTFMQVGLRWGQRHGR